MHRLAKRHEFGDFGTALVHGPYTTQPSFVLQAKGNEVFEVLVVIGKPRCAWSKPMSSFVDVRLNLRLCIMQGMANVMLS